METFENPNVDAFRENCVKSLKFLSKTARKEALKRSRDLDKIFAYLCHVRQGIIEVNDLPRQEFRSAVQMYLIGFYEEAIFHACFSIEMALLVKLDNRLTADEKGKIHDAINTEKGKPSSFTFGAMFDKAKAKDVGIISGAELVRKVVALIEKRNTYIHASNFLSGLIIVLKRKEIAKMEAVLRDIEYLENLRIAGRVIQRVYPIIPRVKTYVTEQLRFLRSMPDFSWCSKDKIRLSAEAQVEEYIKRLERVKKERVDTSSVYKKIVSAVKLKGTVEEILSDVYLKDQSLEVIECSFDILRELGFFGT